MIKEHDLVILKSKIGDIFSNSVGTVVHIYPYTPFKNEYEVEFAGEDTSTVLHLFDHQIQKLK